MTSLDQQIDNCQKLLRMFQEEREQYTERQSLELHDVLESMKQKQRLVEVFEVQKQFAENPPQSEAERKQLRVLGELLEQLLVIEQENEILLRLPRRRNCGCGPLFSNNCPSYPNPGRRPNRSTSLRH